VILNRCPTCFSFFGLSDNHALISAFISAIPLYPIIIWALAFRDLVFIITIYSKFTATVTFIIDATRLLTFLYTRPAFFMEELLSQNHGS
jgi:hypothetical protein